MGESPPPTLKICCFTGQKRLYNVLLQGNLLDPGPLVNYCYLKKVTDKKFLQGSLSHPKKNLLKLHSWLPATKIKNCHGKKMDIWQGKCVRGYGFAYSSMNHRGHNAKRIVLHIHLRASHNFIDRPETTLAPKYCYFSIQEHMVMIATIHKLNVKINYQSVDLSKHCRSEHKFENYVCSASKQL